MKIFLHRPQKLKKLGFESFKNTPLKIRGTPCTYSWKHVQFANTHCGYVFIIKFRKLFEWSARMSDFGCAFLESYTSLILILRLRQFTGRIKLWKWQGKDKVIKSHQSTITESYLGAVSNCLQAVFKHFHIITQQKFNHFLPAKKLRRLFYCLYTLNLKPWTSQIHPDASLSAEVLFKRYKISIIISSLFISVWRIFRRIRWRDVQTD